MLSVYSATTLRKSPVFLPVEARQYYTFSQVEFKCINLVGINKVFNSDLPYPDRDFANRSATFYSDVKRFLNRPMRLERMAMSAVDVGGQIDR